MSAFFEPSLDRLRAVLEGIGPVVVAFSGGSDSAFLAKVATEALGADRVLCATAVSPSLPEDELAACAALAAEWGLRWTAVETTEMDDPRYVANGPDRCARCKTALMDALVPAAGAEGATVVLGVNVDDLGDHRPGQEAAAAGGARFPLVEAGFTKAAVREWSRSLGLSTWDKPQAACLASRVPYGTPVTAPVLRSVGRAEAALRELGFRQCRVRHHGPVARVELPEAELADALGRRAELVEAVRACGYRFVALDLEGFTSGSMNRLLDATSGRVP